MCASTDTIDITSTHNNSFFSVLSSPSTPNFIHNGRVIFSLVEANFPQEEKSSV